MKHITRRRTQGMALLLSLFFVTIAILLLTGLSMRLINQDRQVEHYVMHEECFNGLEAAFARCKAEIEMGEDGKVGLDGYLVIPGVFPDFDDPGVTPMAMASCPQLQFFGFGHSWAADGMDNNGNGQIDEGGERSMFSFYTAAQYGGNTRRMEAILAGRDVNVWRNAIFAGGGQVGGVIKGNVSIHGSVHILGNNLPSGGQALAALDMSGTSLIHNNYAGIPADLQARVPALPAIDWNGESVGYLEANLRVKHGLVGLSGNSEVGELDLFGNTIKETMDGTYVNDGWTGNAVVPDGGRGDPKSVWSDNGWDELYDLGDKVPFPMLADDWRSPLTGAKVWDPSTNDWYTHEDYFDQVLLADPFNKNDGVYNGDIDIYTQGSSFYWNATRNIALSGSLPAIPPAATDDYILFNPNAAGGPVLQVNGQVTVNGKVTIRGKSNKPTVYYSGKAALLVHGDVQLDCNLLTCNNANPANAANSFPVNNILGIMAENNMVVGSVAQVSLMGAFYAQNTISCSKQTNVMGTFVSSYFDMGTNVPSIFQVPQLADNLPLGMIGNYPIMSLSQISWRELGVTL